MTINMELFLQSVALDKAVATALEVHPGSQIVYGFIILLLILGCVVLWNMYNSERKVTKELTDKAMEISILVAKIQTTIDLQKELPKEIGIIKDNITKLYELVLKAINIRA